MRVPAPLEPMTVHRGGRTGWVSPWNYGINEGPIVIMIEHYRTEFVGRLMRQCVPIVTGLRRAGFSGNWL